MIHVLNVTTGLGVGGAEAMLVKVLGALDRERFTATVFSLRGEGPLVAPLRELGFRVVPFDLVAGPALPGKILRLRAEMRREAPTVVQTWMYKADVIGGVVARSIGCEEVVWGIRQSNLDRVRSTPSTRAARFLGARLSRWIPRAILCVSDEAAAHHRSHGYVGSKLVVVPNGFDLDRFAPDPSARQSLIAELGGRQEDVLIGLVARFDPQKDHSCFLRAARLVYDAVPTARFVLCGEGVSDGNAELIGLVRSLGLESRVHLLGLREDLPRLSAALDLAVSSSAFGEGFSNAVGEALASGVPCVVTDVGNARALVGEAGRVVPPESPVLLSNAIVELIELGPEGRRALGVAARQRMIDDYSIESVARRYEALWEEVARGVRVRWDR